MYYKQFHNRFRSEEFTLTMMDLFCKLQQKVACAIDNPAVRKLISAMYQSGIDIDDIYIHDGSYWHVNGALSDIYHGTRTAKKKDKASKAKNRYSKLVDTKGKELTEKTGNAEIGIQMTWSLRHSCVMSLGIGAGTENERNYVYTPQSAHNSSTPTYIAFVFVISISKISFPISFKLPLISLPNNKHSRA